MILIEYLRVMIAGVAARIWRVLRGHGCPCPFCVAHEAFVASAPRLADVPERASDGLPFACVQCGARECDTWPTTCVSCLPCRPGPSRAYLPTLDEQRRRRGV